MFTFYSLLLTIGFILMAPIFLLRREKYAAGFRQRLGKLPPFELDARDVVWIHCVSVGETNAARPLVAQLKMRYPEKRIVVSTVTKTGQELARDVFRDSADAVFYFPFDFKFSVRRALKCFRPAVILIVETELWANFIREAGKSGAKIALVNGRLSEKSFRNYSFIKGFMRRVLTYFDAALMQANADATRLMALGAHPTKVKVTGNVKFDEAYQTSPLTEVLRERFAVDEKRPLILAASTHEPEEKWLLDAFAEVKNSFPKVRLMIAPRHPARFNAVAELIASRKLKYARRSDETASGDRDADIVLLDSIGELRAAYPLAEIVFVGGSLIPHGGQSILEPAVAGKAIVTGFYAFNFTAAVDEFLRRDALIQLSATDENNVVKELAAAFETLLGDAERRSRLAKNAIEVIDKNGGATQKTLEYLKHIL